MLGWTDDRLQLPRYPLNGKKLNIVVGAQLETASDGVLVHPCWLQWYCLREVRPCSYASYTMYILYQYHLKPHSQLFLSSHRYVRVKKLTTTKVLWLHELENHFIPLF